jgi:CubicO group peptidase (beta-lactamase class C family)
MRVPPLTSAIALTLCLSTAAPADDLSTVGNPEALGFSSARLTRITSWFQARVESGELPGAVLAIARDGKLAYLQAVGFQDHAKQVRMRPDSIFWIASMTKPVTSVAAMILVEQGKLDLDAPVAKYLPELSDMQVATEKTDLTRGMTEFTYEAQKRPMTVRDLLRHTSGLIYPPQYLDDPIHRLYREAVFKRDRTLADFITSLGKLPLAHQPGEVWEYSWGVDVLARIVEVQSGQPFDQFLEDHVFQPLHMVDTDFYVPEQKLGRLADPPSDQRETLWDVTVKPKLFSGGGGLVSTASDYLRFSQMLLNGGEVDGSRILKPQTIELMTTNSLPSDIRFGLRFVGPSRGSTWGLGFAIRTDPNNSSVPGSVGSYTWSGAGGTVFWVDPAEKLIAIMMIQSYVKDPYREAFRQVAYGALKTPEQTPPPSPVPVSIDRLADYAGTYDFGFSSSAADRRVGTGEVGITAVGTSEGALKVTAVAEEGPAAMAGIVPGDVITYIDGAAVNEMTFAEAVGKDRGPVGSKVRLRILHGSKDKPDEVTIVRTPMRSRAIELRAHVEAGRLVVESVGEWPVLDFDKGKPLAMTPEADSMFYLDGGDHTRIAFIRDTTGKVSEAALNSGPWELRGRRLEESIPLQP